MIVFDTILYTIRFKLRSAAADISNDSGGCQYAGRFLALRTRQMVIEAQGIEAKLD